MPLADLTATRRLWGRALSASSCLLQSVTPSTSLAKSTGMSFALAGFALVGISLFGLLVVETWANGAYACPGLAASDRGFSGRLSGMRGLKREPQSRQRTTWLSPGCFRLSTSKLEE